MKVTLILFALVVSFLFAYSQKKKANPAHKLKPQSPAESPMPDDFIEKLVNSEYAKSLDSLKTHVAGQKVVNTAIGNAGFILYLDNNSWASAYRVENRICFEFGQDPIPTESFTKINSAQFGDASDSVIGDVPYATERNIISAEVRKSHGNLIEGLAIGDNTFNFAFENGMELDFQLCNDKNNIPSIRVFWEQW
jgi:hypothetical protein